MKRKPHSTSLVLLLVCIFTFWWGVSVLTQRDGAQSMQLTPGTAQTNEATPVVVHESISGGTYTYSGTYTPPSACDSFGSGIRYSAEGGGHVSILLITDNSTANCAQAATLDQGQPFSVSIKLADKNPVFDGVYLNNTAIPAQLVMQN
jgi:hypothetical protein